jgi:hypothetical protein
VSSEDDAENSLLRCYYQAAVEDKEKVLVAQGMTTEANDKRRVVLMLE